LTDPRKRIEFEHVVLPHLDAAHNFARWLVRHQQDAEELTHDAVLRALRFYDNFRGGSARAWLLTIVRNTCYEWLQTRGRHKPANAFDEERYDGNGALVSQANVAMSQSPETILMNKLEGEMLEQELAGLPEKFREVVVLRELEGFSYQEIAAIIDVAPGTVMSRLSRARRMLHERLSQRLVEDTAS